MSRIAKNSIEINDEINCSFNEGKFLAKGKLGEMTLSINSNFSIDIKDNEVSGALTRLS